MRTSPARQTTSLKRLFLLTWTLTVLAFAPHAAHATTNGTALSGTVGYYPRVVRLSDGSLLASISGTDPADNSFTNLFYKSTDGGASFNYLSSIHDPDGAGNCCSGLFVLPSDVGNYSAGTIFFASVEEPDSHTTKIKVYTGTNGSDWNYDSTLATGGSDGSGVWEPSFTIASDGALVVYWSDETDASNHSQKLREARNYGTGGSWQDYTDIVASTIQADRPGMVIVSKTPSVYFMTFEHCGPADCEVHYKTSSDGWNWGNVSDVGTRIQTADGRFLKHTPYNIWSFDPKSSTGGGALLVVGQIVVDSNNQQTGDSGYVLFANTNADGSGSFYTISSPVTMDDARADVCPNYSSPLLQSTDGESLLEFVTDYDNGSCRGFYGTLQGLW